MISAKLTNQQRQAIYRRDGWRCALCDSTKYLQIHHCVKRSQGGTNNPENLITLCADCHAVAHGTILNNRVEELMDPRAIDQAIIEYLADYYAEQGIVWNPWGKAGPWGRR